METILIIAVVGTLNVVCFFIGAKVGQAVSKGEKVEMPNLNPLKAIRENQARKGVEREEEKRKTLLRNIERYDGTSKGQEDVK